ncbi:MULTISPECIES: sugar ABC transporter substrate-binding protein [Cobetia]|jgi:simple sugar transport system substrate-binding protein|uniref:sugar ABC transporter substrate-binding protein n=1 Tax=Cobetia TaxID=204286 RepID=UPI000A058B7E|nr:MULTISPECIES: sugar ABC transporter substrate-binding protein [Cobetia]MDI6002341.1 sugar ABC transporter substrate-binding protein [Cobetia pacifica]
MNHANSHAHPVPVHPRTGKPRHETSRFRRITAGIVTALLAASAANAVWAADSERYVMITHGQNSDPFWSIVKRGADDAAQALGVKVEYRAPSTFDMAKMAQLLDAAVASQPDGLIISLTDADALGKGIKNAVDQKIPVITINSGGDKSKDVGARLHIGQSEYEAGRAAAERMMDSGAKHGLCINQEQGNVGLDARCAGFIEGFDGSADELATSTDPTEIKNSLVAYLNQHSEIDSILALGPLSSEPMLKAMQEAGATQKFQLGTFDLSPDILAAVQAGEMNFAIDQQQYLQGYLPVVFMHQYHLHGLMPAGDVATGPGFVTAENAGQVIELSEQGIR